MKFETTENCSLSVAKSISFPEFFFLEMLWNDQPYQVIDQEYLFVYKDNLSLQCSLSWLYECPFSIDIRWYVSYNCFKHKLWVLDVAVLTSTNNLFLSQFNKNDLPPSKPHSSLNNWRSRVLITTDLSWFFSGFRCFSFPFLGKFMLPSDSYQWLSILLWSCTCTADGGGRTWVRLLEIVRIPAVYYLSSMLETCFMFW